MFCKKVYSELLERYYQLLDKHLVLMEEPTMLNTTPDNLLKDYDKLHIVTLGIKKQNFSNLMYIFAATTTIFILTTIYLSKKAHEKRKKQSCHKKQINRRQL